MFVWGVMVDWSGWARAFKAESALCLFSWSAFCWTDCKTSWGKYVICDIGLYKRKWLDMIGLTSCVKSAVKRLFSFVLRRISCQWSLMCILVGRSGKWLWEVIQLTHQLFVAYQREMLRNMINVIKAQGGCLLWLSEQSINHLLLSWYMLDFVYWIEYNNPLQDLIFLL